MIYIFHRPGAEYERKTQDYFARLQKQHLSAELIDLNTPEGAAKAHLYGIMAFPAVVTTRADGEMVKHWEGDLPPIGDLAYFAVSAV